MSRRPPLEKRLAEFRRTAHLTVVKPPEEIARARAPMVSAPVRSFEKPAWLAASNSGWAYRDESGALLCFNYLRHSTIKQVQAIFGQDAVGRIVPVTLNAQIAESAEKRP
jgi:hypothetical protein